MQEWMDCVTLFVREVAPDGKTLLVSVEPVEQVYTGWVDAEKVVPV